MDSILVWDIRSFIFINSGLSNPFFDFICPLLREKYIWAPLYAFLISFLILNYKKKGFLLVVIAIIAIAISDQLSSALIKPLAQRVRPCNDFFLADYIKLLVNCGSGYSFPSSHASNHFTLAFYFSSLFGLRRKWIIPAFVLWASAISFSQIYVGVHYPLDVLGGLLIGLSVGLAMAAATYRITEI